QDTPELEKSITDSQKQDTNPAQQLVHHIRFDVFSVKRDIMMGFVNKVESLRDAVQQMAAATPPHAGSETSLAEAYPELEHKLRPLAHPLPPSQPGNWLAQHSEPGQTFAEYVAAQPVRKSSDLHTIYLCLVGDFSEAQRRILDLTRDYL